MSMRNTADSRIRYNDAFKREAVAKLATGTISAKELSNELGIDPSMLSRWKNRYGCESFESVSGIQGYGENSLRQEIEHLRSDVATLREIVCRILTERYQRM